MRQVGDRLIPVGVTSGRVHALTEDGGDAEGSRSGSRRRRRNQGPNPTLDRFLGQVDMAGQDLEEVSLRIPHTTNFVSVLIRSLQLMVMEAMRLSLLEHEQQQQRQREEEERNRRNGETSERGRSAEPGNDTDLNTPSSSQRSASVVPPQPTGEAIDHRPSSSLPTNNPLDGLHANGDWRRNPSQFSTLAATVNAANTVSAVLLAEEPRPPPLSSSSTQTGGTDGDTTTISSDSSEAGHPSRPALVIDTVDEDEGGEVNYAILSSSPESPDQSHLSLARTEDGEMAARTRSRTPE
jgi:hypothetical protein